MRDYVIVTDSTCDLTDEIAKELGVIVMPLNFHIDGIDYKNYLDGREMNIDTFYEKMEAGTVPKTSQLNVGYIEDHARLLLEDDKDILYIAFSSGLSGSYNASCLAKQDLSEEYKNFKMEIIDSLCASGGEGLLVYMAALAKKQGMSIEENRKYLEDMKLHIRHCFTVLDVVYLKRGGRLTPSAAFLATVLNIKPTLYVDTEGHLIALEKKHGRKAALNSIIENSLNGIETKKEFVTIVSHAHCLEDAEYCKNVLEEKYKELGVKSKILITNIGPVIGAHSGPGTLAIFTLGDKR